MMGSIDKSGCWVIVVAAGRGARLGLPYNKVFYQLAGRSILSRCFDVLENAGCFEGAVLVLSDEDRSMYEALVQREGVPRLVKAIAAGGTSRQGSVANGLQMVPEDARIIAVHDAARAFVPISVVRQCVQMAGRVKSGVAATECTDTIKMVDEMNLSQSTLDRAKLRAVQTPQVFGASMLKQAHRRAAMDGFEATDDAALVEKYIGPVTLCCSEEGRRNIKLTNMEDLRMMEQRLHGQMRIGHGYDVHKLVEGRKLILCGVEVPHEVGLLGHSDADVATHALMDALLGAVALGDIGQHFPDSDSAYKGISSIELLKKVVRLVAGQGYRVVNVDITIACERPKLAPLILEMRQNLAEAMGTDVSWVSVKATTTEKLGFVGRMEGIEANAVALVSQMA